MDHIIVLEYDIFKKRNLYKIPFQIIRWCIKKASQHSFVVPPLTANHTVPSRFGCQYTRSSTIVYNMTSEDEFTQFLCETGDYEFCGTGSIIRYVNISNLGKSYTGSIVLNVTIIIIFFFDTRNTFWYRSEVECDQCLCFRKYIFLTRWTCAVLWTEIWLNDGTFIVIYSLHF